MQVWGSGIPIKSKATENVKDRNSAFVLRGGSCSLEILLLMYARMISSLVSASPIHPLHFVITGSDRDMDFFLLLFHPVL